MTLVFSSSVTFCRFWQKVDFCVVCLKFGRFVLGVVGISEYQVAKHDHVLGFVLPVWSQNDPVPLVNGELDNVLGQADIVLLELVFGGRKVLFQLLDQLQSLPDVRLDPTVVERARNDLLFRVLFQGERHRA